MKHHWKQRPFACHCSRHHRAQAGGAGAEGELAVTSGIGVSAPKIWQARLRPDRRLIIVITNAI